MRRRRIPQLIAALILAATAGCYTQLRLPDAHDRGRSAHVERANPTFDPDPIYPGTFWDRGGWVTVYDVWPTGSAFDDPWFWDRWDRRRRWRSPVFGRYTASYWGGLSYVRPRGGWYSGAIVIYADPTWPRWRAWPDPVVWWRHVPGPVTPADDDTPADLTRRPRARRTGFSGSDPVTVRRGTPSTSSTSSTAPRGGVPAPASPTQTKSPPPGTVSTPSGENAGANVRPAAPDTSSSRSDREEKRKSSRKRKGMR